MTYVQTLDGGGVERALLRLAAGWSDAGRRVTLAVGDARGPLAYDLPPRVELRPLGARSMCAMGRIAALTEHLGPDILFCPGNHYSGLAAWVKLRLGRACPPIVAKISNALIRRDQTWPVATAYRAWLRLHPAFVDRLVAMSPAMARETCTAIGADPATVSVIPNPPVAVARAGIPPGIRPGRHVIGVGRLARQKRWDRLIAAFAQVHVRDARLTIFGEGAERAALAAQVAALGLGARVSLPGHVADPAPAIAQAAVLALVSDFEGVPGVLREALALGTPVVTTESSVAVREIVTGPRLGTIVPFRSASALTTALDHWLAPGRARPQPVPEPGADAARAYLDLFDRVVRERRGVAPATV